MIRFVDFLMTPFITVACITTVDRDVISDEKDDDDDDGFDGNINVIIFLLLLFVPLIRFLPLFVLPLQLHLPHRSWSLWFWLLLITMMMPTIIGFVVGALAGSVSTNYVMKYRTRKQQRTMGTSSFSRICIRTFRISKCILQSYNVRYNINKK